VVRLSFWAQGFVYNTRVDYDSFFNVDVMGLQLCIDGTEELIEGLGLGQGGLEPAQGTMPGQLRLYASHRSD